MLKQYNYKLVKDYKLSPPQKWWQWTNQPLLNLTFRFEIRMPIDLGLFEEAWQHVVREQPILRAVFPEGEKSTYYSEIEYENNFHVQYMDFQGITGEEFHEEASKVEEELFDSVDIRKWPLLKVAVLKKSKDHYLLIIIYPTYIGDLFNVKVLLEQVFVYYAKKMQGIPIKDSFERDEPTDYIDFLEGMDEEVYKQFEENWKEQLPLNGYTIPTDYEGPNTFESERLDCVYWPIPIEKMKPKGKQSKTIRIYDCIWLAMHNVVSKWTGNKQVVINERSVGRDLYMKKNMFKLLGFYVVDHPISTTMQRDTSLEEGLQHVREALTNGSLKGAIYNYLRDQDSNWALPHDVSPIRHDYHGKEDNKPYFGGLHFYSGRTRFAVVNGELDIHVEVNHNEKFKKRDRLYLLDFASIIIKEELVFGIYYSKNIHSARTIRKLANDFVLEMDRIADYIQSENIRCVY